MNIYKSGTLKTLNISECSITDGLVAWYPLNNELEEVANRTLVETTTLNPIPSSRGFRFNGSTGSIRDNNSQKDNSFITISAWAMKEETQTDWGYIVHCRNSSNTIGGSAFMIGTSASSRIDFSFNGTTYLNSSIVMNLGQWYHVALTYNGTTARSYVDGVEVNSVTQTPTPNADRMSIGGEGTNYRIWLGNISDVRLYDRPLSSEEINILYHTTNPESPSKMKVTKDSIYIQGQLKEI